MLLEHSKSVSQLVSGQTRVRSSTGTCSIPRACIALCGVVVAGEKTVPAAKNEQRTKAVCMRRDKRMRTIDIARELNVSTSALGTWLRGMELTAEEIHADRVRRGQEAREANQKRGTKTCPTCSETKNFAEFHTRLGLWPMAYCRNCQNARVRNDKKLLRARFKSLLHALKARPCMDCGESHPPWAMDFDHRDRKTKKFDVSRAASGGVTIDALMAEVEKCDLVCALCHRYRTYGTRRNLVDSPPVF